VSRTDLRKYGSSATALRAAASYVTFVPHAEFRSPDTLRTLGRHFWRAVVPRALCLVLPCALTGAACARLFGSYLLGAVLFAGATYLLHGIRRLDGLAVAVAGGLTAGLVVLKAMGRLHGDLNGMSRCTAKAALLMVAGLLLLHACN
jgi:hypothetical protein